MRLPTNPWRALPGSPPYAPESDATPLDEYNHRADRRKAVDLSLMPEPYLGSPDAPVLVLGLNPGWSPDDAAWHREPRFLSLCRENLLHSPSEYPFYLLNPSLDAPGSTWWRRRLRWLIEPLGLKTIARGLFCVEYFPYHSDAFSGRVPSVPSQDYSYALVRRALQRNAVVVALRSLKRWLAVVPELKGYPRLHTLRSVQNVSLSPKNCPAGVREILAELGGAG